MRPKLSKNSAGAMAILSRKNPKDCDLFEQTVGQAVTKLSMDIEQGNALLADLEVQLSEAREKSTVQVGEYAGWCEALAGYYASQQAQAKGGDGVPVAAPGGTMPESLDVKVTLPGPAVDKPQDEASEPGPVDPAVAETDATGPKAEPQG